MEVKIKDKIANVLKKRVDEAKEFKNVEEYVNYILEQVVERLKEEGKEEKKEVYSKEDEEKVKERLRGLGYLD